MTIVSTFSAAGSRALGGIGYVDQTRGWDETYFLIPEFVGAYSFKLWKYNYAANTNTLIHHYNDSSVSGSSGNFYADGGKFSILKMPNDTTTFGDFVALGFGSASNASFNDFFHIDISQSDSYSQYRHHYSNFNAYGEQRTHLTYNSNLQRPIYHVSPHYNTSTLGFTYKVNFNGSLSTRYPDGGTGPYHSGGGGVGMCLLKDVDAMGNTDNGSIIVTIGADAYGAGAPDEAYVYHDTDQTYAANQNNFLKINTEISGSQQSDNDSVAPYSKTVAVLCTGSNSTPMWYYDNGTVSQMHSSSVSGGNKFIELFQLATGVWGGWSDDNMRVFKGGLDSAYTWMADLTTSLSIGTGSTSFRVMQVVGAGDTLYVLTKQLGSGYDYKMAKLQFNLGTGSYSVAGNKTIPGDIGNSYNQSGSVMQYYS